MKIAVDIASADNPLEELVVGCVDAVKEDDDLEVIIVGDEGRIEHVLRNYKYDEEKIEILNTDVVIGMHESPAQAVKTKKDSSVMLAASLVGEGKAEGFFSPGNTGATLAASLLKVGRLKGVLRPVLSSLVPTVSGRHFFLMDVGANVDCTPEYLTQFAIMGDAISRYYWKVENPRVGLVSVGEESSKGDALTKKTYERISKLPINFIGNVEPTKIYHDEVDVVVADGFVGNVMLKTTEGVGKVIVDIMKRHIKSSAVSMLGAVLMKDVFKELKKLFVADSYGGAPLVGVNGSVIIGHGHSSSLAVKNGILACKQYSDARVSEHIVENLKVYGHSKLGIFE